VGRSSGAGVAARGGECLEVVPSVLNLEVPVYKAVVRIPQL